MLSSRREVVEIETYHDHRIAMSFGVLGSRLPGLRILDPGCVAKTYPNYWQDWQRARSAPRSKWGHFLDFLAKGDGGLDGGGCVQRVKNRLTALTFGRA